MDCNQSSNIVSRAIWQRFVPHTISQILDHSGSLLGECDYSFGFMPDEVHMSTSVDTKSLM